MISVTLCSHFSIFQSRPHSTAPAAPVVDNRKDRDREREWETNDSHSREKRISKEIGPLDHRGELSESGEKKSVQRGRDGNTNSNSSSSKPSHVRSPCLSGVIYPLISEVSDKQQVTSVYWIPELK